jgi:hypothetical protein
MSRRRSIGKLSLRLFLVGLTLFAATGCLTVMTPLPAGSDVHLEPGDGILVVETFCDSDIEYLQLVASRPSGPTRVLWNLPQGHHVNLVVLPEGNYRWSRIALPGLIINHSRQPVRWQLDRGEQWQASVKAGQINYPGMVVLHRSTWRHLSYRVLNKSGELLTSIEELFPGLLTQFEARYGGAGRDDFLEYYREALVSRSPAKATSDEEATVAPGDF